MYDFIKGNLISKQTAKGATIVVECGNIGYLINTTVRTVKLAGEENLSDDDIKYGLSYGRSVIVEYMA